MAYVLLVLWVELIIEGFSSNLMMASLEAAQCLGTVQVRWNMKRSPLPNCLAHLKSVIIEVKTKRDNTNTVRDLAHFSDCVDKK